LRIDIKDIKYLIDGWMVMPRVWERLERLMRWKYKRKYGRLPSGRRLRGNSSQNSMSLGV
jgi:hypothetical protein